VRLFGVSANGTCRAKGGPGTPKSVTVVEIDESVPVMRTCGSGAGEKVLPDFIPTVEHELLHCCNVWHHGGGDQIVWWHAEALADGTFICEYTNPADAAVGKDGTRNPGYLDRAIRIKVKPADDPSQSLIPTDDWWKVPRRIWLGKKQGQHSGFEDCVMRYDCSDAYQDDAHPNWRYYLTWDSPEATGQNLCTSSAGTGVNAPDHRPVSRYGDALVPWGDCTEQICVNDRYGGGRGGQ
jgi:hypothetical protein